MKIRKILSIIVNLIALVISIIGFVLVSKTFGDYSNIIVPYVKYFTLVTNALICVFSLISIGYSVDSLIKKDKDASLPTFMYVAKLIVSVCAMITFITVVSYLQITFYKNIGLDQPILFWNNIFHHYVAPLAFVCGFIFFDIDRRYSFKTTFFGILVLVIYMGYAIPISNIAACKSWWLEPPYTFMNFKEMGWLSLLLIPAFLLGGYALSVALWLLNRIIYLIFIGDEVKKDDVTEEEKAIEAKVEVTKEDEQEVAKAITKGYRGPRIYHISKRDDKMWQVKFANGKKAIKLFNTQAEAIVFAKKLAKSQEGSIRVHSVKGKIRKAR